MTRVIMLRSGTLAYWLEEAARMAVLYPALSPIKIATSLLEKIEDPAWAASDETSVLHSVDE